MKIIHNPEEIRDVCEICKKKMEKQKPKKVFCFKKRETWKEKVWKERVEAYEKKRDAQERSTMKIWISKHGTLVTNILRLNIKTDDGVKAKKVGMIGELPVYTKKNKWKPVWKEDQKKEMV